MPLIFLFLMCITSVFCNSCTNYTICTACNSTDQIPYVATLVPLGLHLPFANNMDDAEFIMNATGGVQQLDVGIELHTSVNYFCCLTQEQLKKLADVLEAVNWSAFNISFDVAACNTNGDPWNLGGISFVVFLDLASQKAMGQLASAVEAAALAAGIPIYRTRQEQEPQHSTLGTVDLQYPVDSVVSTINSKIPVWSPQPISIDFFVLPDPFRVYFAKEMKT